MVAPLLLQSVLPFAIHVKDLTCDLNDLTVALSEETPQQLSLLVFLISNQRLTNHLTPAELELKPTNY